MRLVPGGAAAGRGLTGRRSLHVSYSRSRAIALTDLPPSAVSPTRARATRGAPNPACPYARPTSSTATMPIDLSPASAQERHRVLRTVALGSAGGNHASRLDRAAPAPPADPTATILRTGRGCSLAEAVTTPWLLHQASRRREAPSPLTTASTVRRSPGRRALWRPGDRPHRRHRTSALPREGPRWLTAAYAGSDRLTGPRFEGVRARNTLPHAALEGKAGTGVRHWGAPAVSGFTQGGDAPARRATSNHCRSAIDVVLLR